MGTHAPASKKVEARASIRVFSQAKETRGEIVVNAA